jgi:uncharacterized membrane protein YeaQ/YmgE (transglycosylase-associated protein family)
MHIIGWIFFGLVVGIVAKFLCQGAIRVACCHGRSRYRGSVVGGFIGRAIGLYGPSDPVGFSWPSSPDHCSSAVSIR